MWLGPILAAVFLLGGMAVLMPLTLTAFDRFWRHRPYQLHWMATLAASVLFVAPASIWGVVRYHVDSWQFLGRMVSFDFVSRSIGALERAGPLYCVNILAKASLRLVAGRRRRVRPLSRTANSAPREPSAPARTEWSYSSSARLGDDNVGGSESDVLLAAVPTTPRWRAVVLTSVFLLVLGVAEAKLLYYSYRYRDIGLSDRRSCSRNARDAVDIDSAEIRRLERARL